MGFYGILECESSSHVQRSVPYTIFRVDDIVRAFLKQHLNNVDVAGLYRQVQRRETINILIPQCAPCVLDEDFDDVNISSLDG